MTARPSPRPTWPSRRWRSGSRCRTSAAESSPTSRRSRRLTSIRRSSASRSRLRCNSSPMPCRSSRRSCRSTSTRGPTSPQNPVNAALVGTGPFTWGEYRPGEYYLLKKNPSYWNAGQPLLDEIVFRVLPDRAAAASSLEAGEIQLAAFSAVPLVDLDRIGQVPGLEVVTKGYEALTYQLIVEINHRNEYLKNPKVRQAIAHAIDKKFVLDTIFLGYAAEATGPVPKNAPAFYTRRRHDLRLRRREGQGAARRGGLPGRRRRGAVQARTFCPRPISTRRGSSATTCARRWRRSGSTPPSSPTTAPATRRRSTPTTPSISPSPPPSSAAIRRSRPRSSSAPGSRTACPSRTRAATRTLRSTR